MELSKYKVIELERTCFACPSQWQGKLDTGETIYIRFRFGNLSIRKSYTPSDNYDDAVDGHEIFSLFTDDGWSGYITFDELKKYTDNLFEYEVEK